MDYKSLLSNIKEDSITETLHLNSRVLLVDGMNTFLRSFAVINYTNTQGTHVGGLVGFLRSLAYVINLTQPTRVICVFDGEGNITNRKNLYSDYKSQRKLKRITNWSSFDSLEEESSSVSQQMLRLIDYLKQLPINISVIDKLEADDIIGYLAPRFDQSIIMSADQDFLQLCSDKVQVYSPIKKKFYGPKEVFDEYGLWPQNFINYKVLMGDTSDNLPGVKGLGPKKLFQYFPELKTQDMSLQDLLDIAERKLEEHVIYARVIHDISGLEDKYKVMDLSKPMMSEEQKQEIVEIVNEEDLVYYPEGFIDMYYEDQLGNLIRNVEIWIQNTFQPLLPKQ
jgi:DNA polymerase-1